GGAGSPGRCRGDVDGGGAGPAQVAVGTVDERLVAGVGVHRGHEALLDAERIVEHLDHRHEAVGGAGGVGHDRVGGGVVGVVVDAHPEGGGAPGRGGRDDDELGAGLDVGRGLVAVGEEPGRLDDDVDA